MQGEILNKVRRLLYILNELDHGEIWVSAIAEDLNVTVRTVQRDLRILEDAFPFCQYQERGLLFCGGI